jgi:PhoD-like phosphatase
VPKLILGPMLRYLDESQATIWVETDGPCEVEVLGRKEPTFCVEDHHYALVPITGLEPGGTYPYEVRLDGEVRWPEPGSEFPPSTIRPIDPEERLKIVFGSCRVAVPHREPWNLSPDEDERGREVDALYALALRMIENDPAEWPDLLLMVGDQVYVDEDSPDTREFIRSRRDTSLPPGEEVADYEEYTRLYWESWGDPVIRWLFSTVGVAMIFDDHDVHDDWNTSIAWLEEMRAKPWWEERIESGLSSYWVYQHIGNLSPAALEQLELFREVCDCDDAGELLRRFAREADHGSDGSRWSYCRDIGRVRMVVFDSREGRVLGERPRKIVDDKEWEWVNEQARGGFDHLLLVDTLPFLLIPALHHVEAWNEAVCAGAWGQRLVPLGERIRRAVDLEHWAAFNESFRRMEGLLTEVASGRRGSPPATIVAIAGDVHHAYLAEVGFPRDASAKSAVYQAVCSPFRNALDSHERRIVHMAERPGMERLLRPLARAAGVPDPRIRWRLAQGPTFDNQFATLELEGRSAVLRIEKTVRDEADNRAIETSLERKLA